jgi:hypothetical protein
MLNLKTTLATIFVTFISSYAVAGNAPSPTLPDCYIYGNQVQVNNSQILQLKATSADGTIAGALVTGTFVKYYKINKAAEQIDFEIRIGDGPNDTIEVFHGSFDQVVPHLKPGDQVAACGVYTTNRDGGYETPKSPDGASVSQTNDSYNGYQENGYLVVNGKVYHD